ncbi:hypothetical protein R1sor_003119 [Riccia sorocarpa]|uniref:Uncharacterized protein n=1 Tax=Riccia sorocarpa TaxID=122646 RepID=A0ABD3H0P1_9MARC
MSFADLFARYREMGAIGPKPCKDSTFIFDEDGNVRTQSNINGECKDARKTDDCEVRQKHYVPFKSSIPFKLTPEGDFVRVSGDEELEEELLSPHHKVGLNLGLLKSNNICKDYYKLTSNVLRSLIIGIREITTEEITPVWQTTTLSSSYKNFSNIFVKRGHGEANLLKSTKIQRKVEIEQLELSSFIDLSKLPIRDEINIADLRTWLWHRIGHPVNNFASTSLEENYGSDAMDSRVATICLESATTSMSLDSQEQAAACGSSLVIEEVQVMDNPSGGKEHMRGSSCEVGRHEEEDDDTSYQTIDVTSKKLDENKVTNNMFIEECSSRNHSQGQTSVSDSNSSEAYASKTTKEVVNSTKKIADCESDHEPLIRRTRLVNQTASGNKQFASSVRIKEDGENPRIVQTRNDNENMKVVQIRDERENQKTVRTREEIEKLRTGQTREGILKYDEEVMTSISSRNNRTTVGSRPEKAVDRQVSSSQARQSTFLTPNESQQGEAVDRQASSSQARQSTASRHNEAVIPSRPKSWCLVGGYVRRFPTKHNISSHKSQTRSKGQPQVPTAA